MRRHGKNLEHCLRKRQFQISIESVYGMCSKLLSTLELVHNCGLVYNDIKLDNILLSYSHKLESDCSYEDCFKDISLNLVDLGFVTQYVDHNTGQHKAQGNVESFRGNIYFSSKH